MNPAMVFAEIEAILRTLAQFGSPYQAVLVLAAVGLAVAALLPQARRWRRTLLVGVAALLAMGELALMWFHWRVYALAVVVDPATGAVTGNVAVPLWIESEKLFVWALVVAVMGSLMRRQRKELLPGVMLMVALLTAGAVVWGRPFTEPLPSFFGQYAEYLSAMELGPPSAIGAFQGMESARQFYYNTWYMWIHPPLLFLAYGAFAISFVAALLMIGQRHSSFETTAYHWVRFGYLSITLGMLLGFPWAVMAWGGEAWWWSGKVNMSLMMWLLYTAYLHARLYLRRKGMWRIVAALLVLSFLVLVLTYLATYVVPGAHSYA
jgi:cytochrome c biogenesis factor